jgi:hypothetical protein
MGTRGEEHMSNREELVKAVTDAEEEYLAAGTRDAFAAIRNARDALKAYDKEKQNEVC